MISGRFVSIQNLKLTELVLLLEVHVNNAAGPDTSHLLAVERTNLGELARTRSVATVLGEEDGDIVLLEILSLHVETRFGEGGVATPRVDVVTPEVNSILGVAAVEVVGHVLTDISIVVGSISHTNLAVLLALDVGLGITDSRLDESAGDCVVWLVGDLVTGKKAQCVVVFHQLINDAGVALIELYGPSWVVTVDGEPRLREIGYDIDSSICKRLHAVLVVLCGIDGIHTNSVGVEFLEVLNVTLARSGVGQRIGYLDGIGIG